jgi:hypothetical protein
MPGQFGSYRFKLPVAGGVPGPAARTGYARNWDFTVEQQLRSDLPLPLAYIGNHGPDLGITSVESCYSCAGSNGRERNARWLYPGLGAIEVASPYVYDIYHLLQVGVTK